MTTPNRNSLLTREERSGRITGNIACGHILVSVVPAIPFLSFGGGWHVKESLPRITSDDLARLGLLVSIAGTWIGYRSHRTCLGRAAMVVGVVFVAALTRAITIA